MKELVSLATEACKGAYNPYSKFAVGAAVKTASGQIYKGMNIENASYSATCCAERVAIFTAIAQGEREFTHIAIVGDTQKPISPCGVCRQVMSEFFSEETKIYMANLQGDIKETSMKEILPFSFTEDDLFGNQ